MHRYNLESDLCKHNVCGQSVERLEVTTLDALGVRILSGKTIELNINEGIRSIFASTAWGSLSNEIKIKDLKSDRSRNVRNDPDRDNS